MSNNTALNTLLKAEEKAVGLQIKLQHLESLLYFLGEFFERETLDPNSPDEPHVHSPMRYSNTTVNIKACMKSRLMQHRLLIRLPEH